MVHRTSISSYLHWCRNWCTQGPIHDNRLFIVDILPANQPFLEARPAGFEPATRGLEVRIDKFTAVRRCPETGLDKASVSMTRPPSFTDVQARCRQTVVNRYKSQDPLQCCKAELVPLVLGDEVSHRSCSSIRPYYR